jgi:hypothetical protein
MFVPPDIRVPRVQQLLQAAPGQDRQAALGFALRMVNLRRVDALEADGLTIKTDSVAVDHDQSRGKASQG